MIRALLLCLSLALASPALAQEPTDDPVALAALLISDGHYDRAEIALAGADTEANKALRDQLSAQMDAMAGDDALTLFLSAKQQ